LAIPLRFCWSKIGVEAGETLEAIVERKEEERLRNGGVFLWGVGNGLGPSIGALLRKQNRPEVLFSPIKTAARTVDVNPSRIILWRSAETIDGFDWEMPPASIVTSRDNTRGYHFALVCFSKKPLRLLSGREHVDANSIRNIRTGGSLGHSQVTAVVEQAPKPSSAEAAYPVVMRVSLVEPYFVRLVDGVPIPSRVANRLRKKDLSVVDKIGALARLRDGSRKPRAKDLFAA
jgi:hypothetical protein